MKKMLIMFMFTFTAICIFAQNPTAVISEMTGTVELKKSGSADWVLANAGDTIDKATIISTGFRSTAVLTIGNSTLMVRPLTRLSLDELLSQDETETINVNLNTGRVRATVNPPAGGRANFSVQTTTASASVRGTVFDMDTVSIQVIEGVVSYVPAVTGPAPARAVTVSTGQESWVNTDTGSAVTPMVAAETTRALPSLTGQTTETVIVENPRMETRGTINIDVTFDF